MTVVESRVRYVGLKGRVSADAQRTLVETGTVLEVRRQRLRNAASSPAKVVEFKRGDHLYREGTPDDTVFRLEEGTALSYQLSYSGRRRVFAVHAAGDFIGLNAAVVADTCCRAVVNGWALAYSRSEMLTQMKRDLLLAGEISSYLLRERQWSDEHTIGLGLPALERVARYLLRMEARQHQNGSVYLPMPRRDLADYLALTIETVCRIVTQLKTSGAIRLESPNAITVASRAKLRAAAGLSEL